MAKPDTSCVGEQSIQASETHFVFVWVVNVGKWTLLYISKNAVKSAQVLDQANRRFGRWKREHLWVWGGVSNTRLSVYQSGAILHGVLHGVHSLCTISAFFRCMSSVTS